MYCPVVFCQFVRAIFAAIMTSTELPEDARMEAPYRDEHKHYVRVSITVTMIMSEDLKDYILIF